MKNISVGVDIGGTNITLALVHRDGKILKKAWFPTAVDRGPDKILEDLVKSISQLIKGIPRTKILSIGIGAAGRIDQEEGIIRFSPNLFWKNIPIRRLLKKRFRLPVYLDNDANTACWGAYIVHKLWNVRTLFCITLGTGVGGGIIIDGKLYRGATGGAGEIGHIPLDPNGPRCNCGSYGCLERYIGSNSFVERVIRNIRQGKRTSLKRLVKGDLRRLNPKVIQKAAEMGDRLALEAFRDFGRDLGIVLAGLINCLNPEAVLFAGGISKGSKLFFPSMKRTIRKRAFSDLAKSTRFIRTRKNEELGVIGAALLNCDFKK